MLEEQIKELSSAQLEELEKRIGKEVIKHFLVYDFGNLPVSDFLRQLDHELEKVKKLND